jgi:hydrogenase maturation protease
MNLLMLVEECSHLLILDAVDARKLPGTLIELRREDIPLYTGIKLSEHQVTFQEVLGFASIRGKLPEHLHLIGAQPADLSIGLELSTAIDDIMPEILACSKRILIEWGLLTDTTTLRS